MYRPVYRFRVLKCFCVAVFVKQSIFQNSVVSKARGFIGQKCSRKRKDYGLRLRDPDDAELLGRTCKKHVEA